MVLLYPDAELFAGTAVLFIGAACWEVYKSRRDDITGASKDCMDSASLVDSSINSGNADNVEYQGTGASGGPRILQRSSQDGINANLEAMQGSMHEGLETTISRNPRVEECIRVLREHGYLTLPKQH